MFLNSESLPKRGVKRFAMVGIAVGLLATGTAMANAAERTNGLRVSQSADRSNSIALSNATINGIVSIFYSTRRSPERVRFFIDASSEPVSTEYYAPFDLGSTKSDGTANLVDTKALSDGTHKITVETLRDNRVRTASSSFTVRNSSAPTATTAKPAITTSTTAKPIVATTTSTPEKPIVTTTTAAPAPTTTTTVAIPVSTGARDIYSWPFAWDSPWNLPLSSDRTTVAAGLNADHADLDHENISINPAYPVKSLNAAGSNFQVYTDPSLSADGTWNNCSTFLTSAAGNKTIVQGQPLKLTPGGNPTYSVSFGSSSLTGDGIAGCHGGSTMSGIGGSIRIGEISGSAPIRHAIKMNLPCIVACSQANNGYMWPATSHDSGYNSSGSSNYYGGSNPNVRMGTLLTLPQNANLDGLPADVKKIAVAMQTYGVYVVDTSANRESAQFSIQRGAENEFPNYSSSSMMKLVNQMQAVTNNTKATPGGGAIGSKRVAPCAPAFADGTGGAPGNC